MSRRDGVIFEKLVLTAFEQGLREVSTKLKNIPKPIFIGYCWESEKDVFLIRRIEKHLRMAGLKVLIDYQEGQETIQGHIEKINSDDISYVVYGMSEALMERLRKRGKVTGVHLEIPRVTQRNKEHPGTVIPLLLDGKKKTSIPVKLRDIGYIDFRKEEKYCFSVFEILRRILPLNILDPIIREFKQQYEAIEETHEKTPFWKWFWLKRLVNEDKKLTKEIVSETASLAFAKEKESLQSRKKRLADVRRQTLKGKLRAFYLVFGLLSTVILGVLFIKNVTFMTGNSQIRSSLAVPNEKVFLKRLNILRKIDRAFSGSKSLQAVALVGIGGVGKTTLARHYAQSQKTPVIWEVNAETKESLITSFEALAEETVQTEQQKTELRHINKIADSNQREKSLLLFIKRRLKETRNWLLIYDNVRKFQDIQNYFPQDPMVWGKGRVLITSRNKNVANNRFVTAMVPIKNLSFQEQKSLFAKIVNRKKDKKMDDFLKKIPPFPLDTSVAAYYLKTANISYDKYLKYMKESSKDFIEIQKELLKEITDYEKSRYGIITLALRQLIKTHPDFKELLLFISLIDSQNIPRELLEKAKKDTTVDRFVHQLKKHSLITGEALLEKDKMPVFSIHRSTQEITLQFFNKTLEEDRKQELIQNISHGIENYMRTISEKRAFSKAKITISHTERFLKFNKFEDPILKAKTYYSLGKAYQLTGYYKKTFTNFEKSIEIYKKNNNEKETLPILSDLGYGYCLIGKYKKSVKFLNPYLQDIEHYYGSNSLKFAKIMAGLGTAHKYAGNYKKSEELFKRSLQIYENLKIQSDIAWISTHLATLYTFSGKYKKSKKYLEKALVFYKKQGRDLEYAWLLIGFADLYNAIGFYQKALNSLEKTLKIYTSWYGDQHLKLTNITSFITKSYIYLNKYKKAAKYLEKNKKIYLENLTFEIKHYFPGKLYAYLGDFEKSKKSLEKGLKTCKDYYGSNHVRVAEILNDLGEVYLLNKELGVSEGHLRQSLKIFQQNKHPDAYICYENLATLYLKKAKLVSQKNIPSESKECKEQAFHYLNEALKILKKDFPKDSPHIGRIQSKINNF